MPSFVLLQNFTDQGARNIKDTIGRAEAFQDMAKKSGGYAERALLDYGPLRCRRRVRGGGR